MKDHTNADTRSHFTPVQPVTMTALADPKTGILAALDALLGTTTTITKTGVDLAGANAMIAGDILRQIEDRIARGDTPAAHDLMALLQSYLPTEARDPVSEETPILRIATRKKTVLPMRNGQSPYIASLLQDSLAFGLGPAGTGKTFLAVGAAAQALEAGEVERIILTRPAVEAGEKLGYLPGDLKEKVDPFMQPLYDALNTFFPPKSAAKMIEEKIIEVSPLAYMRGRTLKNAFVILDEAQNTTTMQMKMFLTRMGEGSRMVVVGDPLQNDLARGVESGLNDAASRLSGIPGIGITRMTASDVVRHPLVAKIVAAYEDTAGS